METRPPRIHGSKMATIARWALSHLHCSCIFNAKWAQDKLNMCGQSAAILFFVGRTTWLWHTHVHMFPIGKTKVRIMAHCYSATAWVEEPINALPVILPRTIHSFSKYSKPVQESGLLKPYFNGACSTVGRSDNINNMRSDGAARVPCTLFQYLFCVVMLQV